jgi:hypothetical protein
MFEAAADKSQGGVSDDMCLANVTVSHVYSQG